MSLSNDTIAAYHALPTEAREALAEQTQGPGWLCRPNGRTELHPECPYRRGNLPESRAWIPADPTTVLAVAVALGDDFSHYELTLDWASIASDWHSRDAYGPGHDGTLNGKLQATAKCVRWALLSPEERAEADRQAWAQAMRSHHAKHYPLLNFELTLARYLAGEIDIDEASLWFAQARKACGGAA